MKIVVVGGVGSGKSTVTAALGCALAGSSVIDSVDRMVRQIHLTPHEYFDSVEQVRWAELIKGRTPAELRDEVFSNTHLRNELEKMTSPHVLAQIRELNGQDKPFKILEFRLFFEKATDSMVAEFDVLIFVDAPEAVRRKRCLARGWSDDTVQRVMSIQADEYQRAERIKHFRGVNPKLKIIDISTWCSINGTEAQVYEAANQLKIDRYEKVRDICTKVGVIGGTFDPITVGHEHLVQEALKTMDYVIISLAVNPTKKTMFSINQRKVMLNATVAQMRGGSRVLVMETPYEELLASWAARQGAKFMFRGIRTSTDWEYEQQIQFVQNRIAPDMSMVYVLTPRDLLEVSSTLVRNSLHLREWELVVKGYVNPAVMKFIMENRNG